MVDMIGMVDINWRIFEAYFIWLLSSKISQLETLKLLEVLVVVRVGQNIYACLMFIRLKISRDGFILN